MANEFIVKNGLLVESKDPGIAPISILSSSVQLTGITNVGTTYPQHYLIYESNPASPDYGKWGFFTGSAVSFLIENPSRYSLVTATGTVYVNAGFGNGIGSVNDVGGISLNTPPPNQTTPTGSFTQRPNNLKPAGGQDNVPTVQYFYPLQILVAPSTTNTSVFTNVSDTLYDGLICDYIITSPVSGTALRRTGTVRASWNRTTGIAFVDVAAATIGNVGTQLFFNFNKTAGNIQMRVTTTAYLSNSVYIACYVKLFTYRLP
jgi:hypothetical protein